MAIDLTCQCGQRFRAKAELAGKRVACPKCSQPLTIVEEPAATGVLSKSLWDELPAATSTLSPAAAMMRSTIASAAEATRLPHPDPPMTAGINRPAWEFGVGLVLCLGVLIVAVCLLGVSIVRLGAASESTGWQQTTAKITQSEVISQRMRRGRTRYTAVVRYSYLVDGIRYSGDRVGFGDEGTVIDGRWTASKYKMGTEHSAWYNPKRPSEAVLEKGISLTNVFWLVASMLVLAVSAGGGVFCGVLMWRRMKMPGATEKI